MFFALSFIYLLAFWHRRRGFRKCDLKAFIFLAFQYFHFIINFRVSVKVPAGLIVFCLLRGSVKVRVEFVGQRDVWLDVIEQLHTDSLRRFLDKSCGIWNVKSSLLLITGVNIPSKFQKKWGSFKQKIAGKMRELRIKDGPGLLFLAIFRYSF